MTVSKKKPKLTKNEIWKKKATGTNTAAGSRSMKQNLDTGVEIYDKKAKKNQRHAKSEKPNMYLNIFNNTCRAKDTEWVHEGAMQYRSYC